MGDVWCRAGRTFSKVDNEFFIGVHTDIPEDFNEEKHVFQGKVRRPCFIGRFLRSLVA